MKLSIVVPTFRRAALLDRCLTSVAAATADLDVEFEVVVSDNASPDETPDVVARHARRLPIRSFRNAENLGALRNIRLAAQRSTGSHILFVTDDDEIEPDGAAAVVRALRRDPSVRFIHSSIRCRAADGTVVYSHRPFAGDRRDEPSLEVALRNARYGWVLSRLVFRREDVEWDHWDRHIENAYPSVILAGRFSLRFPSLYLDSPVVRHLVLNEVFWDEFGHGWSAILRRTHADLARCVDAILEDVPDRREAARRAVRWKIEAVSDLYRAISWPEAMRALASGTPSLAREIGLARERVRLGATRGLATRVARRISRRRER